MEEKIDYSRHYKNWHANTPGHINKMKEWYAYLIKVHFPRARNARIMKKKLLTGGAIDYKA